MEKYLEIAIERAVYQAKKSLNENGIPIGAVLLKDKKIVSEGHNLRLQENDITAHGEITCLRNARENILDPMNTILITTLSPCRMCSGALQIAGIEKVIVLDKVNYTDNQESVLRKAGIIVDELPHQEMIKIFEDWKNNPKNKKDWEGDIPNK